MEANSEYQKEMKRCVSNTLELLSTVKDSAKPEDRQLYREWVERTILDLKEFKNTRETRILRIRSLLGRLDTLIGKMGI